MSWLIWSYISVCLGLSLSWGINQSVLSSLSSVEILMLYCMVPLVFIGYAGPNWAAMSTLSEYRHLYVRGKFSKVPTLATFSLGHTQNTLSSEQRWAQGIILPL